MSSKRKKKEKPPSTMPEPSPLGQSPEEPIVFTSGDEVAQGNMERANAEPEPQALHSAKVPGVEDPAIERREKEHELDERNDQAK
jgi:hypothetical protein